MRIEAALSHLNGFQARQREGKYGSSQRCQEHATGNDTLGEADDGSGTTFW